MFVTAAVEKHVMLTLIALQENSVPKSLLVIILSCDIKGNMKILQFQGISLPIFNRLCIATNR